jgi:hypothetical protein
MFAFVLEGLLHQAQAFFRAEQQVLQGAVINGDIQLIKQARSAPGDIDVPVVDWVKRAGKQGADHIS